MATVSDGLKLPTYTVTVSGGKFKIGGSVQMTAAIIAAHIPTKIPYANTGQVTAPSLQAYWG